MNKRRSHSSVASSTIGGARGKWQRQRATAWLQGAVAGLLPVVTVAWLPQAASGQTFAELQQRVQIVETDADVIEIRIGDQPVAVYHARDDKIPRPFFSDLCTLDGHQVTRRHPPDPGRDLADHPEFHPGLWLAFGDISGSDYWRNKAAVEFVRGRPAQGLAPMIRVLYRYQSQAAQSKTVCFEGFRAVVLNRGSSWLLMWESTFAANEPCVFGDQEEMGLGVRVATEMRSETRARGDIPPGNGRILDAEGRRGAEQIWGQAAAWCDYSGEVDGTSAGITIFCHPDNFRPSWWHARDYGLLVANPFGRAAMKHGEPSEVTVAPGSPLRLRFGVWVHGELEDETRELQQAYADYLRDAGDVFFRPREVSEESIRGTAE